MNSSRICLLELVLLLAGLALHLVPLVDADDQRAPAFVGVAGDGGVQRHHALGGVQHQQHHVGHADVAARHHHAQLLRHIAGLALAADAGGIDEDVLRAVVRDGLVHGIARGAGDGRNDGPLLAGERVEQGRFADVGPADDGDLDSRRSRWLFGTGRIAAREPCGHAVQQRVHADAMLGRYREDVGNPEAVELVGQAVAELRYRSC